MGEDTVSGLMFADDFVGTAETPDGLQKQMEKALEYTRKISNLNKSTILVCNEDNKNPVEFKWKWGEEELSIVDQYTYLGVEIKKNSSRDAHINKVIEKGKVQIIGKMDVIQLDTRIKRCIKRNVIVPKL